MKQPPTIRAVAKAEVSEAYRWYERQRPGLGEEFLQAVRSALEVVEGAPHRYPAVRGDVRRILLRRFPNSILYLAEPDETVVIACFHARRS